MKNPNVLNLFYYLDLNGIFDGVKEDIPQQQKIKKEKDYKSKEKKPHKM